MTSTLVIMAAGRGTRMQQFSADQPKHLLPILGRPFLEYTIERARAAGFTTIIIIIGYQRQAFEVYRNWPGVILVEQHDFHKRYGTAAAVENAKAAVDNQPFAVVAGDNLYSVNDLHKMTINTPSTWIGGLKTAAWRGMGILKLNDDGYLERIIEKPTTFMGDLVNASLYHFTPNIFQVIEGLQPSPRGEYEITDAVNIIAQQEAVNVFELEDRWLDLTGPEDIAKIEHALRQPELDDLARSK